MNVQEIIYAWKPIDGIGGKYYIKSVCRDYDGLKVVLVKYDTNNTQGVVVNFKNGFESYRESTDLLSMNSLQGFIHPYEGFIGSEDEKSQTPWAFFIVKNSEYLRWASYQSYSVSDTMNMTHYAIWTEDYTLDVLSVCEPTVEIITLQEKQTK